MPYELRMTWMFGTKLNYLFHGGLYYNEEKPQSSYRFNEVSIRGDMRLYESIYLQHYLKISI